MKQFCLGIITAIGLTLPALGQGVDPLIGTWNANIEKSTWTGNLAAPKSQGYTFTGEGQNFTKPSKVWTPNVKNHICSSSQL